MHKEELELQVLQLNQIQRLCNDLMEIESPKQSNKKLLSVLKKEYNLSEDETQQIQSLVAGKNKKPQTATKTVSDLKEKLNSYCLVAEVNTFNKQNEPLTYQQIKQKSQTKRFNIAKKLEQA